MFVSTNVCEGMPARLYRSPFEIRRDMTKISKQIKEADEMLSVRNILVDMIYRCTVGEGESWISELEALACQTRKSCEGLERLTSAINDLSAELEESLCALGLR